MPASLRAVLLALLWDCALVFADTIGISTDGVYKGSYKWVGITTVGAKVFAAPAKAPMLLEYDTATGTASGISTEHVHSGEWKWSGITTVGTMVFAAPFDAPVLLAVDTCTT